ncbi:MAG: ion transporter [Bacteroidia bacterium]|nr:ion transporter [Bacteroidia bacterium]
MSKSEKRNRPTWLDYVQRVIFETDTRAGKIFDIALLVAILFSFLVIVISTVEEAWATYGQLLYSLEWFFTILFTIEYFARIISVENKRQYVTSFFGIIDLLSIIPTYLSLFLVGSQNLAILRTLRLLRVFRVLELPHYMQSARVIIVALQASRFKITVFMLAVLTMVIVVGSLMYLIEGKDSGFSSIPRSVYWAIVTITTVGYGDIAPRTILGQTLASVMMIVGYAIIAVPTGIVTSEFTRDRDAQKQMAANDITCPKCRLKGHEADANYCRRCSAELPTEEEV